jgi:nicotinamidase-related amidase
MDDMRRLAAMIRRLGKRIDDIHVTLDSHQTIGIERPKWWKRVSDGAPPAPFTALGIHPDGKRIVKIDFSTGAPVFTEEEYTTYLPSMLHTGGPTGKGSFGYLQALAAKGRYPHVVWTVHCVVGTWGHGIVPEVAKALGEWENDNFARVDYVVKGNNPFTEHFSGVQAEVPDPKDPGTQINTRLIRTLEEADIIPVTGEALSHCVANTARDVASAFADPRFIEKLVLITDTCSNVGGFDFLGDAFIKDLCAKGMRTATSVDFLA